MITLTAGAKAIFDTRNATIYPILTVYDDAGVGTVIEPKYLPKRPKRAQYPVGAYTITPSPVMRCDIVLAPTDAIRALFLEKRKVTYSEVINGQTFPKFTGFIDKFPDKGWMVGPSGTIVPTLTATCYSYTQRLVDADDEVVEVATPLSVVDLVMSPVTSVVTTWMAHGANNTSNDIIPNYVNAIDAHVLGTATAIWYATGQTLATGVLGTDFYLTVTGGALCCTWMGTANAPPPTTSFRLTFKTVLGFVAASRTTVITAASNASPIAVTAAAHGYATGDQVYIVGVAGNTAANGTWTITNTGANTFTLNTSVGNGVYTGGGLASEPTTWTDPVTPAVFPTVYDSNGTPVEQIDQAVFPYEQGFAVYQCSPVIMGRVGVGTGASTREKDTEWQFTSSAVAAAAGTATGAAANRFLIYKGLGRLFSSTTAPRGYEVMFVGLRNCKRIDPAIDGNDVGQHILNVYTRNGVTVPFGYFKSAGVPLSDFAYTGLKAIQTVTNLMGVVPPNYILADTYDGAPTAKLMAQKSTADFTLTTLKSLKTNEPLALATVYTCFSSYQTTEGASATTASMDYSGLTADFNSGTYATIVAPQAGGVVVINNSFAKQIVSVKIRFEGEVTAYLAVSGAPAGLGLPLGTVFSRQISPPSGLPVDVTLTGFAGVWPQRSGTPTQLYLYLTTTPWTAVPKFYTCEVTYQNNVFGDAFLTNDVAYAGGSGWQIPGPQYSPYRRLKYMPPVVDASGNTTDIIARWMIQPHVATTDGDVYYVNKFWHRNTQQNVPGFAFSSRSKLATIATQNMDQVLRQSTTQKAVVQMEPMLEIGDTVQVVDIASGTTYNRLAVGFEDSDSWEDPSTTWDLANYS